MRRVLLQSPAFARDLKKWLKAHADTANAIADALAKLSANAADPSLRSHKLHGSLSGSWSCSAGYDIRIVFEFVQHEDAEAILLHSIGTHDQVY